MKSEVRKKIESFIISTLNKVDISGINGGLYKKLFKQMPDKDFEKLVSEPITIFDTAGAGIDIDHMRTIEVCRELGFDIEQYCWLTDPKTGICSKTAVKHLLLKLPVRRQTQLIDKKVSVAKHNRNIDSMTGQVVGASKGSGFSFPQIYVMYSKGYDQTIRELIQPRGGDNKGNKIIDRMIRETGHGSLQFDGSDKTRVSSSITLCNIFTAMHISNSLNK